MWDLIRHLPDESAWKRRIRPSSALEENVATILDFVVHAVIGQYSKDTFDPEKWGEHKQLALAAKRNSTPPPPLPNVAPVAMRPRDWGALTTDLTHMPEPPIVEIEGHEAHERLQALLNN